MCPPKLCRDLILNHAFIALFYEIHENLLDSISATCSGRRSTRLYGVASIDRAG